MTINTEITKVQNNGNGSTKNFPYSYPFFTDSDLQVITTNTVTNVNTYPVLNTDYTIVGSPVGGPYPNGATVSFVAAPNTTTKVTIKLNLSVIQSTEFMGNSSFPAESNEQAIDRLTLIVQQLKEIVSRSIILPISSSLSDISVPTPAANKNLKWNSLGTSLINSTKDSDEANYGTGDPDPTLISLDYISGFIPTYINYNSISLSAGRCKDSNRAYDFIKLTATTLDITVSGVNGLDTGVEEAGTPYYIYLIGKTDGTVNGLFSKVSEAVSGSITLPSGYTLKRQLPIIVQNYNTSIPLGGDAWSKRIIPFIMSGGWPQRPSYIYTWPSDLLYGLYTGPIQKNSNGELIWGIVDLSSFVPIGSNIALLNFRLVTSSGGGSAYAEIRPKGRTHTGFRVVSSYSVQSYNVDTSEGWFEIGTDQLIEYKIVPSGTQDNLGIYVRGFTVTGIV